MRLYFLLQSGVLEWCVFSSFVICKSEQSWVCLHSFTTRHIFVIIYVNYCENDSKCSTCCQRQLWCSLQTWCGFHSIVAIVSNIKRQKQDATAKWWRHIQLCSNLYIIHWDITHNSNKSVWTKYKPVSFFQYPFDDLSCFLFQCQRNSPQVSFKK